jgi:hypothetical protein
VGQRVGHAQAADAGAGTGARDVVTQTVKVDEIGGGSHVDRRDRGGERGGTARLEVVARYGTVTRSPSTSSTSRSISQSSDNSTPVRGRTPRRRSRATGTSSGVRPSAARPSNQRAPRHPSAAHPVTNGVGGHPRDGLDDALVSRR